MRVYYAEANYGKEEIEAVIKVLKEDRLAIMDGKQVHELEKKVATIFRKDFGLMTNSGSSANLLLIQALLILGKLKKANEKKTKEELIQELATISPIFREFPFFMNEDFTLVDCYLAPIMWRLTSMGINLPYNKQLKPLLDYQNKIFERPGFIDSLTTIEKDLRAD